MRHLKCIVKVPITALLIMLVVPLAMMTWLVQRLLVVPVFFLAVASGCATGETFIVPDFEGRVEGLGQEFWDWWAEL